MKKTLVLLAISTLFLGACASGPQIASNVNPGTDFRSFETYNYVQPLGTDRSNGVRTPISSMLISSMDQQMAARGLTMSNDPDILVDFIVTTEDRIDVRQTPTHSVHRSHWHQSWSTWPTYRTTVRQYTEGSLVIDIIARRQGMLIAEGGVTQRINSNEFTRERSDELVEKIMASIWAN